MYTVKTIANYLDVDRETVRRWVTTGKLKGIIIPGGNHTSGQSHYQISNEDFIRFLELNPRYMDRFLCNRKRFSEIHDSSSPEYVAKIDHILELLDKLREAIEALR